MIRKDIKRTPTQIQEFINNDLKNLNLTDAEIAKRNNISIPVLYRNAEKIGFDMEFRTFLRSKEQPPIMKKDHIKNDFIGRPPLQIRRALLLDLQELKLDADAIMNKYYISRQTLVTISRELNFSISDRRVLMNLLRDQDIVKEKIAQQFLTVFVDS